MAAYLLGGSRRLSSGPTPARPGVGPGGCYSARRRGGRLPQVRAVAAPRPGPQREARGPSAHAWGAPADEGGRTYAALGLGQAMVDLAARVDDAFLDELGLTDVRGGRKVVDAPFRSDVLARLDDYAGVQVSAGGSLSNTLVALSRLGEAAAQRGEEGCPLRVAMAGSIGDDPLGGFYRREVSKADVEFLSAPKPGGATGSVVVLTTPDAQRTMLSHPGSSAEVPQDDGFFGAVGDARALVVEGYLWEEGPTAAAIANSVKRARESGTRVVLTASDVTCVERFRSEMLDLCASAVDLLFCNADEAAALTGASCPAAAAEVAARTCPLVVVTDGKNGSYVAHGDVLVHVPPHRADVPAVDTCGAGDAYAGGFLFGLLQGASAERAGAFGAMAASAVLGHAGARLSKSEAARVVSSSSLAFARSV